MIRSLLLCACALAFTGQAEAELIDARLGAEGEARLLWLAFDSQPEAVRALAGTPAIVELDGVTSPARTIDVALSGGPQRLVLAPVDNDTLRITLIGIGPDFEPEIREGGVMIAFPRAEPAPQTAPVPERTQAPRELRGEVDTPLPPAPQTAGAPGQPVMAEPPAEIEAEPAASAQVPEAAGLCAATQAAIAASPWDLDALSAHAGCLAGEGRTDQAIGLYERVLAFEPGHYEAAVGLARLRAQRGEASVARALFLEAARNAQTDGEALQARAAARRLEEG